MLTIASLGESHDRKAFDCGVAALNEFLRKTALQHRKKGLSNTFILADEDAPEKILGFFTLSFLEVEITAIPKEHSRHLPKLSRLPAAKLARLAVDRTCQGKGYGDILVADAIKRIMNTAKDSGGITGLFVDATDDNAVSFYVRFGFLPLRDSPLKLFIPLKQLTDNIG